MKTWTASVRRQLESAGIVIGPRGAHPIHDMLDKLDRARDPAKGAAIAAAIGMLAAEANLRPLVAEGVARVAHIARQRKSALEASVGADLTAAMRATINDTWPEAGTDGRRRFSVRAAVHALMQSRGLDPLVDEGAERQLRTVAADQIAFIKRAVAVGIQPAGWKD